MVKVDWGFPHKLMKIYMIIKIMIKIIIIIERELEKLLEIDY